MPLDPALAKEVSTWLVKATEDLRAAQVDLKAEPPLLNDSLFHCQQACEKALKALLCCLQTPFRKVHDLNELVRFGNVVISRIGSVSRKNSPPFGLCCYFEISK